MIFKNKIANITVSLSWVFMIIIGSFFIMTSYNIISKYKDNEDAKFQIQLKQALRNIFNEFGRTAGIEESSLAPLKDIFQDSEVYLECNGAMPLMVLNGDYFENAYVSTHPTFMTKVSQKNNENTYLAVENFKMPFKITNMLAIISKKNMIIFDGKSDSGKALHEKFKRGSYKELNFIEKDFTQQNNFNNGFYDNNVKNQDLNSIIFITDTNGIKQHIKTIIEDTSNYKNIEVYGVEIGTNSIKYIYYDFENGEIDEIEFDSINLDNSYALETMAVFSNPQTFNCSYNLLFNSIDATYEFYIQKTQHYINSDSDEICLNKNTLYQQLLDKLKDARSTITNNQLSNIADEILSIKNAQNQLEDNNCPYIY